MKVWSHSSSDAPGVYKIDDTSVSAASGLRTGVPLFIGFSDKGYPDGIAGKKYGLTAVSGLPLFETSFGSSLKTGFLGYAVRGFFLNGGKLCHVTAIDPGKDIRMELDKVFSDIGEDHLLDDIDLLCVPDVMTVGGEDAKVLQQKILDFCVNIPGRHERFCFAILDSLREADIGTVVAQKQALSGDNGALYYPWIKIQNGPEPTRGFIPPCGHIAGIYARSDEQTGVYKAPANEIIEEALDLGADLSGPDQDLLNPANINCLRSFPGRGIRVWGARTLSGDECWRYINVRRLFLSVCRRALNIMAAMVFEPNDSRLWMRVTRELNTFLGDLFRKGAFAGSIVEEAFYVKCDSETNPTEVRDRGELVVELGIAAASPGEFIVVRIVQKDGGSVTACRTGSETPSVPVSQPIPVRETPPITIIRIVSDPPGSDVSGEFVLLRNNGSVPVDMTNWVLSDRAGHDYRFPRFTLAGETEVRVWTGPGVDSVCDLFWGHGAAVWNNTGDRTYLHDSQSNIVCSFVYEAN